MSDVCVEFDSSYGVLRDLNCLQDQNRATRRNVFVGINLSHFRLNVRLNVFQPGNVLLANVNSRILQRF